MNFYKLSHVVIHLEPRHVAQASHKVCAAELLEVSAHIAATRKLPFLVYGGNYLRNLFEGITTEL